MNPTVTRAEAADLPVIYQLFEQAIAFQKKHNYKGWDTYDKEYLKKDVEQKLLYKIVSGKDILCIFSVCYSDPLIWREMERGDAIYLHRIVLNRLFENRKLFKNVLQWALQHASERGLKNIRMDTWADNEKIIRYYKSYGFKFVENFTTADTPDLPLQHRNLNVALLELPVTPELVSLVADGPRKINIQYELSQINKYWSQHIIGNVNGQLIKLAKGKGPVHWHKHDDQDELFLVQNGHLTIQLRDGNVDLYPNEMYVVPRGVEHAPVAHGDVEFLIMGLAVTSNKEGGQPEWAAAQ